MRFGSPQIGQASKKRRGRQEKGKRCYQQVPWINTKPSPRTRHAKHVLATGQMSDIRSGTCKDVVPQTKTLRSLAGHFHAIVAFRVGEKGCGLAES